MYTSKTTGKNYDTIVPSFIGTRKLRILCIQIIYNLEPFYCKSRAFTPKPLPGFTFKLQRLNIT